MRCFYNIIFKIMMVVATALAICILVLVVGVILHFMGIITFLGR